MRSEGLHASKSTVPIEKYIRTIINIKKTIAYGVCRDDVTILLSITEIPEVTTT
jgi:hypothetical protein